MQLCLGKVYIMLLSYLLVRGMRVREDLGNLLSICLMMGFLSGVDGWMDGMDGGWLGCVE